MHPAHHAGTTFLVPRRGESPDVGYVPTPGGEPIRDEIAEVATAYVGKFRPSETTLALLCAFGMEIVGLLKRRAEQDIEDFPKPMVTRTDSGLTARDERKVVAAQLGRILDWICKGRRVPDMGPRVFVVASHIRRSAIDARTDQDAAHEIGNNSRASVNKIKAEFRRALGADYPGENGKSSNTKARCKNSRIKQLKN